ncbi:MAG TPA: hypothetical protein VK638_56270 [Edaphobacter sp.]|nr:hypothetical protein [Edaphobacter sp.]
MNAKRGSEQYQLMNSSMAYRYDICELAAGNEFRTEAFDCSRFGKRRIVFGFARLRWFLLTRHTGGLLLPRGFSMSNLQVVGSTARFPSDLDFIRTPFPATNNVQAKSHQKDFKAAPDVETVRYNTGFATV